MARTAQVTFRLGELQPELASRYDSPGAEAVQRELARYYGLLRMELATVDLSGAECCLIADALNGTLWEPVETTRLLWASIDDAIRMDDLDAKWGVHGDKLVERLRALTPGQCLALADAIERAWRLLGPGDLPYEEVFARVGLLRSARPALEAR